MPIEEFVLPTGEVLNVFYVAGKSSPPAQYLNAKRRSLPIETVERLYRSKKFLYQAGLVKEIEQSGLNFDTIICPPSSAGDAQPYRDAILDRWPVNELSDTFTRRGNFKAQDDETSVEDLVERELVHSPDGSEPLIKSLLIVDESLARGRTAAAMIALLRRAGMPDDARISIAVCAKMT